MIPQPMRFVHGQALRPETFNQLLDTLRRLTPIAGPGILLHHSPNGTTFSVKPTSAPLPPAFNHPFKVTLTKNADGTYTAKVLQGRFFTLAEGIAKQVQFALEKLEATDGGWTANTCSYGDALYIKKTDESYTLEWGTDTANALYIIASIEGDRYATPPRLEVKQHLLSDLYFLESTDATGIAWTVRSRQELPPEGVGEAKVVWEVYHPVWVCGRATYLPEGMTQGTWNTLDKTLESGTLYAVLQEKASALVSNDDEPVWAFEKVYLTNKTADIPAEAQPDRYKEGHRCTVVAIGCFSGAGESLKWTQWHEGAIVERTPSGGGGGAALADGLSLLGPIRIFKESDGAVWLKQGHLKWSAASAAFVENFDNPIKILRLDQAITVPKVNAYDHPDPYANGGSFRSLRNYSVGWNVSDKGSTDVAPDIDGGQDLQELLLFSAARNAVIDKNRRAVAEQLAYLLDVGDKTDFAALRYVQFTSKLSVTEPSDETAQGALNDHRASITVLAESEPADEGFEAIFKTEVEEANEASTYEAAGGSNG